MTQIFLRGLEHVLVLAESRKILNPEPLRGILLILRWKSRKRGAMLLFKATVKVNHAFKFSNA